MSVREQRMFLEHYCSDNAGEIDVLGERSVGERAMNVPGALL